MVKSPGGAPPWISIVKRRIKRDAEGTQAKIHCDSAMDQPTQSLTAITSISTAKARRSVSPSMCWATCAPK